MKNNKTIIVFLLLVAGCTESPENAAKYAKERADTAKYTRQMGEIYAEELEEEDQENESITNAPLTFMGRNCTVDCSGHEAGYRWAEENGIDDSNECDGNSDSFNEGCQSYVEEQQ